MKKMKNRIPSLIIVLIATIFIGCSSDDDTTSPNNGNAKINIVDAKLSAFPLFGITPVSTEIIDPTIVDNKETAFGEINIVVPSMTSLDAIAASITSDELNLSRFRILHSNSVQLSYEGGVTQTYKIVNVRDESEELLHYKVSIVQEVPPIPSTLKVTDFKFEASKNIQLTNDVIIEKTVEDVNFDYIYLFVPVGTDFSDLTPTATFDAEAVFYNQGASSTTEPFPTVETSLDFAYPKRFTIVLKDEANDRERMVFVIVDVKNPVRLENESITTPNATVGTSAFFTDVTRWVNQGNHKLEFQKATTYENRIPDTGENNVIRSNRELVPGDLAPGESAGVHATVRSNIFPSGNYKTTAVFYTRIVNHSAIDDLIEPVKLEITANIID